jgi:hypothetical protein
MARHGKGANGTKTKQRMVRSGVAWQGPAGLGEARAPMVRGQNKTLRGGARRGLARRGRARRGKGTNGARTKQDSARRGSAGLGQAWSGEARQGSQWLINRFLNTKGRRNDC